MKRIKNLYPRLAKDENLREAFRKAARGRRMEPEVLAFGQNLTVNLERMGDQFRQRKYDLGDYHFFVIRDPKVRSICAASFPERVFHHAVMNVCETVFEKYHIFDSYACRKGKGNLRAVARARQFAGRNAWFLKLDIAKFFDNIDHQIALRLLGRLFGDPDLLNLFEEMLASYHVRPGQGVPIGNLFSQHLANFYLAHLDHWLKEERHIKPYLRYMDDCILFAGEKKLLLQELAAIKCFLEDELKLELKSNIQLNRTITGVPFLGYRIFPGHVRLTTESLKRFSRKYRAYEQNYCQGQWSARELADHLESLCSFVQNSDSLGFRRFFIERFGVLA